jgi:hypothetical protein
MRRTAPVVDNGECPVDGPAVARSSKPMYNCGIVTSKRN